MDKLKKNIYLPITKVDDEERMVYGWASTPEIDSDGEIIKTEAFEKALPNYLKFPTLREMHQPKVAGTVKQTEITDKGFYIGAKVVSDEAWKYVKEGLYAGFSIGGNVVKRVGNIIQEIELVEISLVDVPANKGAVVELWKAGKLSKNAETAYSMSNLMIQIKDKISYFEYLGKETKELKQVLEIIKGLVSREALEAEPADGDNDVMSIFDAATVGDLQKKITIIEAIDFAENKLADALRKGVILAMKKKADELKKEETTAVPATEVKPEGETPKVESVATPAPETTPASEVPATETPAPETTPKTEEKKEVGDLDVAMQKIAELGARIEKLTPAPVAPAVDKAESVTKAIDSLAGTLTKVVDTLTGIEGRIAILEKQPAALKSKAVVVAKTGAVTEDVTTDTDSPELKVKKARLADLEKIFDTIGANDFAKSGYSVEAQSLKSEISRLTK